MAINKQDLEFLADAMAAAHRYRDQIPEYKKIKTDLSRLFHQTGGAAFAKDLVRKYTVARTVDPEKLGAFADYCDAHRDDFDAYGATYYINVAILEQTGFGAKGAHAKTVSAISKYAYFATDYAFPIFDSMAKNTLRLVQDKLRLSPRRGNAVEQFYDVYGIILAHLRPIVGNGRNLIDELDALLWTVGMLQDMERKGVDPQSKKWGDFQEILPLYRGVKKWLGE